jgi:hypothetical protein
VSAACLQRGHGPNAALARHGAQVPRQAPAHVAGADFNDLGRRLRLDEVIANRVTHEIAD